MLYIKDMVLLYVDTETTGLNVANCSIWQLAGYITDTTKNITESFDFRIRPYRGETISEEAAVKTNVTQEQLDTFPSQSEAFNSFVSLLGKFVDLEDWNQRVIPVGYNISFDLDFLRAWFIFNNSATLFSKNIYFPGIDVMYLAAYCLLGERSKMRNFQLSTVYEKLTGKSLTDAHNAMADIDATKELLNVIVGKLRK